MTQVLIIPKDMNESDWLLIIFNLHQCYLCMNIVFQENIN